jgi:hypothetical protein
MNILNHYILQVKSSLVILVIYPTCHLFFYLLHINHMYIQTCLYHCCLDRPKDGRSPRITGGARR